MPHESSHDDALGLPTYAQPRRVVGVEVDFHGEDERPAIDVVQDPLVPADRAAQVATGVPPLV